MGSPFLLILCPFFAKNIFSGNIGRIFFVPLHDFLKDV